MACVWAANLIFRLTAEAPFIDKSTAGRMVTVSVADVDSAATAAKPPKTSVAKSALVIFSMPLELIGRTNGFDMVPEA